MKTTAEDTELERGTTIELEQIEIVTDEFNNHLVEIYILDRAGDRIEGGQFNKAGLMKVIMEFYNKNY